MVSYYDPDIAPDPKTWLALDEGERMRVVKNFHVTSRIKVQDVKTHAALHTIVENQIAAGIGPCKRAIARLQREGLSRHDALHAIGMVILKFDRLLIENRRPGEFNAIQSQSDAQIQCNSALDNLSAAEWKCQYGSHKSVG